MAVVEHRVLGVAGDEQDLEPFQDLLAFHPNQARSATYGHRQFYWRRSSRALVTALSSSSDE
jgi:hypothetical protein